MQPANRLVAPRKARKLWYPLNARCPAHDHAQRPADAKHEQRAAEGERLRRDAAVEREAEHGRRRGRQEYRERTAQPASMTFCTAAVPSACPTSRS